MNELIVPIKVETKELFTENGVDAVLLAVDEKIAKFKAKSVETKKGRDEIRSFKMKITKTRTFLEKQGKEFVAEKKAAIKVFDSGRKKLRDGLTEREVQVRKPLTEYEEAEKARIEAERQQEIFNMDHEEALSMNDFFNRERAIAEKEAELARVEEERRQKEESERLEKERIERENRIAQEAKEMAEREAQEAIEEAMRQAEEKALQEKEDAERKIKEAKEAKEQAEREKIATEERAKLEAERAKEQAEREKCEAIKAAEKKVEAERAEKERLEAEEKAKAKRKAENKKHQARINNEILQDLMGIGVDEGLGERVIKEMALGGIRHTGINY